MTNQVHLPSFSRQSIPGNKVQSDVAEKASERGYQVASGQTLAADNKSLLTFPSEIQSRFKGSKASQLNLYCSSHFLLILLLS